MTDATNPPHYKAHPSGVECVDVAEWLPFNLGNALKYIWRAGLKGAAREDLEKARWYLLREEQRRGVLPPPADVHLCEVLPEYTRALVAVCDAGDGGLVHKFCSELRVSLARGWIIEPAAVSRLVLSVELRLALEDDPE